MCLLGLKREGDRLSIFLRYFDEFVKDFEFLVKWKFLFEYLINCFLRKENIILCSNNFFLFYIYI